MMKSLPLFLCAVILSACGETKINTNGSSTSALSSQFLSIRDALDENKRKEYKDSDGKYFVCHYGNQCNPHIIKIAEAALAAHLSCEGHGSNNHGHGNNNEDREEDYLVKPSSEVRSGQDCPERDDDEPTPEPTPSPSPSPSPSPNGGNQ